MAPRDGKRQCRRLDTLRYFDTISRHEDGETEINLTDPQLKLLSLVLLRCKENLFASLA